MEIYKEQQMEWVDALNHRLLTIEQDIKQLVDDFIEHREASYLFVEKGIQLLIWMCNTLPEIKYDTVAVIPFYLVPEKIEEI